ncbi:hypothetical protein RB597_008985 [Gaeumannomyces tritici]
MNIIELYAVLIMGLLAICPCITLIFQTSRLSRILIAGFERFVQYPLAIKGSYRITRLELLILVAFLSCNLFVLAFRVLNVADFAKRAAVVSAINIIPLFLGGNPNPLLDLTGVSVSSYHLIHHWIGGVAILEGLVHAGLSIRSGSSQSKISGCIILLFWCIYPSEQTKNPPFQLGEHWKCFYSKKGQEGKYLNWVVSQDTRSPGRHVVMACGDSNFTSTARQIVIDQSREDYPIQFVESEYRPSSYGRGGKISELKLQEQGDARAKMTKKTGFHPAIKTKKAIA